MGLKLNNKNNGMQPNNGAAPKVKKEKLKNVSKFSKTRNVLVILALVVVGVLALNFVSTMKLRDTVSVVTLASAVPQDGIIKLDNMVEVEMSKSEYERQGIVTLSDGTKRKAIVTWAERESINNTYASYYIRQGTPVYWDAVGNETPKQYS